MPDDLVTDLRRKLAAVDSDSGVHYAPLQWDIYDDGVYASDGDGIAWTDPATKLVRHHPAVAALIVAAVNALPELLDRLEAAEALEEAARRANPHGASAALQRSMERRP